MGNKWRRLKIKQYTQWSHSEGTMRCLLKTWWDRKMTGMTNYFIGPSMLRTLPTASDVVAYHIGPQLAWQCGCCGKCENWCWLVGLVVSINVVTLCVCQIWLVCGWVIVFGSVYHALRSAQSQPSLCAWAQWVPSESRRVNRHIAWYTSPFLWSYSVDWCLVTEISADVRETVGHQMRVCNDTL